MKNKTIEFNTGSAAVISVESPWYSRPKTTYKDLILKHEYASRRYKFPLGQTWFRVVPAMPGSDKGWMLGVHALSYAGGCHAHPKTITSGAKSVFDLAYAWCKENREEEVYSKQNKNGYKLLADPYCLFWMILEENGKSVARLFLGSGYDGSRGGVAGLGYQIWQISKECDEDNNLIGNPADPLTGTQICVEKRQTPGSRYPSYTLKRGRIQVPINELVSKLDLDELGALTPLENVVHIPTEDEEWKLLEHVIDATTVDVIRASVR